jgi:hypothetical protein
MLTEAQVAQARGTFPGCGDINAENAVDKLFAAAQTLQSQATTAGGADKHALVLKVASLESDLEKAKAALPVSFPNSVLLAMAHAARTHLKVAVEKQAINPIVADMLAQRLIGTDDAPSKIGLTPGSTGECLASAVFEALSGNGKAPQVGYEPAAQPAPRAQHGAPQEKPMTDDRYRELMSMTSLGAAVLAGPAK